MKRLIYIIGLVLPFLCFINGSAIAQPSSRGTDFYLSFLPNYHANTYSKTDSLYIYVVAEQVTKGSINLRSRSGLSRVVNFTISNPQNIYTLSLSWNDYELYGYNQPDKNNAFGNSNDNERASTQAITIHADHDVAVYALNKADKTSDASLIFPTTCLGTEYRVLSYKSDGDASMGSVTSAYTPSEFSVVATQDNTDVQIHTTCPTTNTTTNSISVRLQSGQAFLVQSQFSTQNLNYDLSGSSITASKPIAVFAGQQRACIPENGTMNSRDCLYEQLLPLSVWGTKYLLTPLAQPTGGTTQGSDLYRVVASEDSTVLKINDKVLTVLTKNAVYEAALNQAALLTASKPVMVALYKKSSSNGFNLADGDPFMMVIPPRRQYLQNYRFTNVQVGGVYHQQYVTVIASMNDVASLRLDGKALNANFSSIGTSCYAYASITMTDGAHSISCATPFGLYVYGYGSADSYGYVGGMAFYPDSPDIHLDAGNDVAVCPGTTVPLHVAHAGNSIRWTPKTGLSCDTCVNTIASPAKTTMYYVTGIDSSGCVSNDSVLVTVRNIQVQYSIGSPNAGDSISIQIGSTLELGVYAQSDAWDTLLTNSLRATIRFNPNLLMFLDSVNPGDALPLNWSVRVIDSLSQPLKGLIVVEAFGDSSLNRSGELFAPVFRSLLDTSFTMKPELQVSTTSKTVSCATNTSKGAVIQFAGCAVNLRHIVFSPYTTTLQQLAPNPVRGSLLNLSYSVAFDALTEICIYNTQGELVLQAYKGWSASGNHVINLDIASLSNGVYYAVLSADGVLGRQSIVVDR